MKKNFHVHAVSKKIVCCAGGGDDKERPQEGKSPTPVCEVFHGACFLKYFLQVICPMLKKEDAGIAIALH